MGCERINPPELKYKSESHSKHEEELKFVQAKVLTNCSILQMTAENS